MQNFEKNWLIVRAGSSQLNLPHPTGANILKVPSFTTKGRPLGRTGEDCNYDVEVNVKFSLQCWGATE